MWQEFWQPKRKPLFIYNPWSNTAWTRMVAVLEFF